MPSSPRSDSAERTIRVMSRKGVAATTPLRTIRIVPAFSVTNRRPLPSPAGLMSVGARSPLIAFSSRIVVVAGLNPPAAPAAVVGVGATAAVVAAPAGPVAIADGAAAGVLAAAGVDALVG